MNKKSFTFVSILTLIVMFAIGIPFGFAAGVAPSLSGIAWFLGRVVIKFAAVLLFGRLFTFLVANRLLGTTVSAMYESMKTNIADQENLSPVSIIGGLGVATALIFALAHATSFQLYMYEVLTKGSIGMFVGLLFATYRARHAGVLSASQFASFYRDPGNNQIVIYVVTMFNVAIFLAMMS